MPPAPGPASGRPRHAVKMALLISAVLHVPLLAGFLLLRMRAREETPVINSRVSLARGACLLSLEDAPPTQGRSEEESFPVTVAPPESPSAEATGAAPRVDIGPLVRSQPASGGGRKGTGGGAAASFFGTPIKGQSVVYVIDRSLSMGPSGALNRARAELLVSLQALPATARFQVILYNCSAQPLRLGDGAGLLPADPATRRGAAAIIRATCPEGNTDHVQALRCGLGLRPDLLFFVTDADDLNPEQVRLVTGFNGGRTVIHTVCVARRPEGTPLLEQLARANGGRCLRPSAGQPQP